MDDFQRELNELKEFIAELKADRAATKEKEKREAWTKYVSLSVVIIAVIAAIASQWSGKYGSRVLTQLNDATYNQTQASDEWAYYQAKSIKQNVYEVGRDELGNLGPISDQNTNLASLITKYGTKIATYNKEQAEIKEKAEGFVAKRNEARENAKIASEKGGKIGRAISCFSVSIAMASICLVTKRKPLWFMSMIVAGFGIFDAIMAWLL